MSFLKYKFKKINLTSLAFSVSYSLCSYSVAYINQPMWTDCIWLLPLIIIGLERLVNENKPFMYIIVLAYTIYTNFYIAFSICIFVLLYFIVMIINIYNKKTAVKETVKSFIFCSLMAGGLSAFSVLSVAMELSNRLPVDNIFEGIKAYHSLPDVIGSLFMFTRLSYEFFVPNIYSGIFIIPFIGLYVGNNGISVKKRISFFILSMFLLLSMNINILDFIWHGFHFPNQLPGRWSFIFSFLVLTMGYEGLNSEEKPDILQPVIMFLLCCIIFVFGLGSKAENTDLLLKNTVTSVFLAVYIIFALILFAVTFYSHLRTDEKKKVVSKRKLKNLSSKEKKIISVLRTSVLILISVVIIGETGINSVYCAKEGFRFSEITNYFFNESMNNIRENVLKKDNTFYRTEMNPSYTFNPGLLYDYRGISYYSSTMNGAVYNLLKSLGNRVYAKNVSSVYNTQNIFTNSLFSVKYVIDRDRTMPLNGYEIIDEGNDYRLLMNKNCLPIAFPVKKEVEEWLSSKELSPLEHQNDFFTKAVGTESNIFVKIKPDKEIVENAELETGGDWTERHYIRTDNTKSVTFDYSFTCDQDGPYYAVHNFIAGDLIINAAGTEYKINSQNPVKYIGELKKGDVVTMNLNIHNMNYALYNIELYRCDYDKFYETVEKLKSGGIEITNFSSDSLEGNIYAKDDNQLFFTSIPDDGGWKIYCDGKRITSQKIADSLIAFTVPSGSHNISFKHHTHGLLPGMCISILSLCLILAVKYKKTRKI